MGVRPQTARIPSDTAPTTPVTVTQFVANGLPAAGTLAANGTVVYQLQFVLPNLPGVENNKVQGDSLTVSSDFSLIQS